MLAASAFFVCFYFLNMHIILMYVLIQFSLCKRICSNDVYQKIAHFKDPGLHPCYEESYG